ncbi:tetratricopeptide repeat protein [Exilibacterium tricleocarpae]|uniref:Tetratricopeptide repeat protein n=1 Tax=Exilibacterium tricleocarpae TaxID=2591008 RepID=A0A545U584_9GAMM|nr:tetratricopeptide repeat protein [Exilibacterium tricleocarpae]TQV84628.1 tetratricopeptide repeat protein [Exilibacterium tricleocarpae]
MAGAQSQGSAVTDYLISPGEKGEGSSIARIVSEEDTRPKVRSTNDYQLEIDRVETEQGAYGSQLSEHLVGLGITYQTEGEHDDAIEAFKRAMHVNRVNEGLYSLSQVPILERLIESHVARGQWSEANDRHQYLYWLHRRNFGTEDPRMLPVIDKLSAWHLNAYALDMGAGLFNHLISAHKLFNLAVDIIDTNYGKNDLRLIDALRGITVSNYYLATYKGETEPSFQLRAGSEPTSAEQKARLDQYITNSYNSGKRAISRMVNVYANNPDSPPWAEAKAKVELGDWYLLFNKWQSALAIYQESHDALRDGNIDQTQIDLLFGQPVALPDLPLVDSSVVEEDEENQPYVLVSFDVTPYGRARNVAIIESMPEDNVRIRSRVRKALKLAKFRPRFENGSPTLTTGMTHRYLFADD